MQRPIINLFFNWTHQIRRTHEQYVVQTSLRELASNGGGGGGGLSIKAG